MRKHLLVAVVVVAAIASMGVSAATAGAPAAASGTNSFGNDFTFSRATGGFAEFCTAGNPGVLTGTFSGTTVFVGCVRSYSDGSRKYNGLLTFTGSVAGCGSGTVVFQGGGAGAPDGTITRDANVAIGGTLGVEAKIGMVGNLNAASILYSGSYSC